MLRRLLATHPSERLEVAPMVAARSHHGRWIALGSAVIAVICLLALAIIATVRSRQREWESNRRVLQSRDVSDIIRDISAHVEDAEIGQRGYLLTGSPVYLVPFDMGRSLALADIDRLDVETRDNAQQAKHLRTLRPLVANKFIELEQTVDLHHAGDTGDALTIVSSTRAQKLTDGIRAEIAVMQAIQSRHLTTQMAGAERASHGTLLWVGGILVVAVGLLGAAAWSVASLLRGQAAAEERIRGFNVALESKNGQLQRANAELAALATTDGLTGLTNHRAFQERLAEEVSRAARYNTPLSLILLDVDNFKLFNDTQGHPAGDAVLKTVASLLLRCARNTDIVARYGGEEFAIILPQTGIEGAEVHAGRLRAAVENYPWNVRNVTASFGVASLWSGEINGAAVVARADEALYESKAAGRNYVSSACSHPVPYRQVVGVSVS